MLEAHSVPSGMPLGNCRSLMVGSGDCTAWEPYSASESLECLIECCKKTHMGASEHNAEEYAGAIVAYGE